MLDWFRRIQKVSRKLSLPSRDSSSGRSQVQLNPQKLTPSPEIYFAQVSYLAKVTGQLLEQSSVMAPTTQYRQKQLMVAQVYAARHRELISIITSMGYDSVDLEDRVAERIDSMLDHTAGVGWHEALMRLYVAIGILEDFARATAKGLTQAKKSKVLALLNSDELEQFTLSALQSEIGVRPEIVGRLAMYGRSLVADVLLEVSQSVSYDNILTELPTDEVDAARARFKALEPFTSDLIAAHAVRMDRLGLTS